MQGQTQRSSRSTYSPGGAGVAVLAQAVEKVSYPGLKLA